MLSKLNLRTKLLLLCSLLSAVSVAVGVMGLVYQNKISGEYGFVIEKVNPKSGLVGSLLADYRKLRINVTVLALSGLTPEAQKTAAALAKEAIEEYHAHEKSYLELGFIPGQKELYDKVSQQWSKFQSLSEETINLAQSNDPQVRAKMMDLLLKDAAAQAITYTAAINDLLGFHERVMQTRAASSAELAKTATVMSATIVVVGVLFGFAFGFLFANGLAKSLARISESVSLAAEQTSSGGTQLAAASVQLSSGSTEAAASLEETVASIEELSSMVKMNTGHAQEANVLSQKSREAAEKGEQEISKLINSMSQIASGSKKIEEIINVIDDIAFQTNLLALNAAVEAARAGEQGKGFAVVAEAVRSLAQRSALAAKDISALITDNVSQSEDGAKIASESGAVLKDILMAVKKVADLNGEIATGSQEQASGLEQITKAMNQLDQATQGNAASSEEVAASSEEMSHQAQALLELVEDLQKIVQGNKESAPAVRATTKKSPSASKKLISVVTSKPAAKPSKPHAAATTIPFDDEDSGSDRKIGDVSGF